MVNCKRVTELVTDYLEGHLSRVMQVRFRFHLSWCRHCRAYVDQMRMTIQALRALPHNPAPLDTKEQLLQEFRSSRN
ncbi:MAG: zf-HC2 domain-containing protein [Bradymonadales bacterium]|nr:zf-HC2 domain-containing protein [Bradymonadales bacterium]